MKRLYTEGFAPDFGASNTRDEDITTAIYERMVPQIDLTYSPTAFAYFMDQSRYSFILGPVGSGKTVTSVAKPLKWAFEQRPSPQDNLRYFKLAIVRNSMPELWRTTIETFVSFYSQIPKDLGINELKRAAPTQYFWRIPATKTEPGLHYQVDFFSLDRPDQVKSLLSYEPTAIYLNEVREIPKAIVDACGDRIGRYPSMAKGGVMPTTMGVLGDSNPPDEDHYLYEAWKDPPEGWKFYMQPTGIVEVEPDGRGYYAPKAGEIALGRVEAWRVMEGNGGRFWAANPDAENLPHLPIDRSFDPQQRALGRGSYYLSRIPGKDQSWIDSYYRGKFVFVRDGKPVTPEFNPEVMALDTLPVVKGVELTGGIDMGGGTFHPAGLIGQRYKGIYLVHAEICVDDVGLKRFGELFKQVLVEDFSLFELGQWFGDPAGNTGDEIFETTGFEHMKSVGIPVKAAPTQDPDTRIQAIKSPMLRMVDGRPGILINRRRCPKLVKALSGAWQYRRLQVAGSTRYAEKPDKGPYSHVADALGYWMTGAGEIRVLKGRTKKHTAEHRHTDEYDYFGD